MRNLHRICWYLWEGLPTLLAFPIDTSRSSVTGESWFSHWEDHWPRYVIGTLGFVVVAFTLAGCLCCRRQRCPKGFQDDAGNGKEFKDGSTAGTETTIERRPSASLELEVPRLGSSSRTSSGKVQLVGPAGDCRTGVKPKPPSSSLFSDVQVVENNFAREQPCREWFEPGNCHVPRERLKYLREIGRGWFGKVVEGTAECPENSSRGRGVVVRILTEEATNREKAWFLGEATPYLKLHHPNIPTLLGSCLEADPYLLLFESCPAGDLKGFLRSNRDKGTCETLRSKNVPTRMALDIANALEHMHENGFAHTDLSARNCLVAPDLSAKLGDYGTGVEKYPGDYYVVGDRALPIRWSAPESLECTATTIETRTITPRANIWSYGVLLWEIATWGERPYNDLGDEQVIEMIFSLRTGFASGDGGLAMLNKLCDESLDVPSNFRAAIEASWKFFPDDRSPLGDVRQIICGKTIEDFERRWENLRPNGTMIVDHDQQIDNRNTSLRDLRLGDESSTEGDNSRAVRARFRLGPGEPVESLPSGQPTGQESGSETEEESWRGRVERGAYTEKVKQKSKSVADLMVLVHIDSDSDAEVSLGPQSVDKTAKKRLPASGSDGDLRSAVLADEFDEALRKLREPSVCSATNVKTARSPFDRSESVENLEKPKLLTLTQQGRTPILRLSFGNSDNVATSRSEKIGDGHDNFSPLRDKTKNLTNDFYDHDSAEKILSARHDDESMLDDNGQRATTTGTPGPRRKDERVDVSEIKLISKNESTRLEGHVLRLVSKGDPELPLLRYVPERASTSEEPAVLEETPSFDSFRVLEPRVSGVALSTQSTSVDVELWNDALAHELEKKNPGYDADPTIFENFKSTTIPDETAVGRVPIYLTDGDNSETIGRSASLPNTPINRDNLTNQSSSAPDTPRNYHRHVVGEDLVNVSSSAAACSLGNLDEDSSTCEELEASEKILRGSASAPDTPQSRGNYSVGNVDEDSSTGEELGMIKRSSHEVDDEEERKHLSTPDDERSSDSGFRDKESCEEEESPVPGTNASSIIITAAISSSGLAANSSPLSASAEEEQMRILFELDTILDAEYYGSFNESGTIDERDLLSPSDVRVRFPESDEIGVKNRSISESLGSTESTDIVETVRANSCEPDFLDSRSLREIGHDEEYRKLEDSRTNGEKGDGKNSSEICDATETDTMSECSLRTDHNQSVESSSLGGDSNKRWITSVDSEKNRGDDSSICIHESNVDSVDSEKNRGNDSSICIHEFNVDSVDAEKDRGNHSSVDLEKNCGKGVLMDSFQNCGGDSSISIHGSNVNLVDSKKNHGNDSTMDSEKKRGDDSSISIHGSNVNSVDSKKNDGNDSTVDSEQKHGDDSSIIIHGSNVDSADSKINHGNDSSVDSEKNRDNDSSVNSEKNRDSDGWINIHGSNMDSADPRERTDGSNDSADTDIRSFDRSSPCKLIRESDDSENNRGDYSSIELRGFSVDSSDSWGKIDERTDTVHRISDRSSRLENLEKSGKSPMIRECEDLADSNPSTDLIVDSHCGDVSENSGASEIVLTDSTSRSSPRADVKSVNLEKSSVSEDSTSDLATIDRSSGNLEKPDISENSTTDLSMIYRSSENLEKPDESKNSTIDRSSENFEKPTEASDAYEVSDVDVENSTSDSPLKAGCRPVSDLSTETREADNVRSDGEQWSSRENVFENDDEEDSSTMSLRSDNSYVSFGLDEEFVAAIRNELREKLPRAQMPVVEALDPRDEKEPSINEDAETKRWEDEETEDNPERGSGGVDISIRYNIYGTPLSPILEERESAGTSESLVSKEDSRDASIASRVSALSEDVLVVDTLTNRAMILDGTTSGNGESSNLHQDDDRDTSHGDFSDEENLEYTQNNVSRGMESKRISMGSGGAPLPSPEEETKWQQQFPLPLQMQDDLMSTSFGTDRDWDSQDEDEGDDDGEDGEEDEEENSSSSGEFVWKRYDESHGDLENVATRSPPNKPKCHQPEADLDEEDEGDEDDEEEEEEFTPSAWDATLAPHRSALRSPEKTPKSGDQKKNVWFKKQRYHCVYEYPKETPVAESQGQAATTWEPTMYADWEEMMDEPRLDIYPMEYDETNRAGDEEFYVSSSNRPFQFQSGDGKYVSQFFPGASSTLLQQQQPQQPTSREGEDCQESQDEVDRAEVPLPLLAETNGNSRVLDLVDSQQQIQQSQLGELRHTRDRLKLNLLSTSGAAKTEQDTGNENRSQEVEAIEISKMETSLISKKETEASVNEESPKIEEESSKFHRPLELKIAETEIFEDLSTTITKSLESTSNDEKLVVLKETVDVVEGSSRKIDQLPNDTLEGDSGEGPMKDDSSKYTREPEDVGKSIVATVGDKRTSKEDNSRLDCGDVSSRPSNRDDLAVRAASNDLFTKDYVTRPALLGDCSAVIEGRDETDGAMEISSSNDNSRTIGDQKDSLNSMIVEAASDTVVAGQIVDIKKLETEKSAARARPHCVEDNSVTVEKSESTGVASVLDASAVPSTIYSPDDETRENFVRSSQS